METIKGLTHEEVEEKIKQGKSNKVKIKTNESILKILRKNKGLSQEELGNKLNVARQTVSKWELGETTPEMDKLEELSDLFEISIDELVKDRSIPNAIIKEISRKNKERKNRNLKNHKSKCKFTLVFC